MNAITVHPENQEQLEKLKSILSELEIPYENQKELSDSSLIESVEKGIQQSQKGEVISFATFKEKYS